MICVWFDVTGLIEEETQSFVFEYSKNERKNAQKKYIRTMRLKMLGSTPRGVFFGTSQLSDIASPIL